MTVYAPIFFFLFVCFFVVVFLLVIFLCEYYVLFSFSGQDAKMPRLNCPIIACNSMRKQNLAIFQTQSTEWKFFQGFGKRYLNSIELASTVVHVSKDFKKLQSPVFCSFLLQLSFLYVFLYHSIMFQVYILSFAKLSLVAVTIQVSIFPQTCIIPFSRCLMSYLL